ncbi:MAG TPA: phosphotransferase [Ktedonosporobacter sp.]|jgi:Ser/Thr protein kinase RdoA (MazF antagonist)|nr:phosphotransferase [Ktedonosporobacter sp.]
MHNHEFDDTQEVQAKDLLDLNAVMQAFGIHEWQNLGETDTARADNLSLLVDIQGQRYELRERPEGLAGEDLNHRYAFRRYLQQNDIPIPALWLTPDGRPVVTLGEDDFELQQWAEGEFFDTANPRSLEWVEFAGTMLGRIHLASQRYAGDQHRWPSEVHMGGMVQNWLNLARSKAEQSEIHALAAALSQWVEQWEAVLPSAMMSIGAGRNLPEFHLHGDYHALNLRFGPSGVTVVMGLEASRWEKRIFEVAYALFYFSALAWQPGNSLTRPLVKRGFEPERMRRFLQAYGELCPPAPGEAALLADALLIISPIATINGPLEDLFYVGAGLAPALVPSLNIDDLMERLSWAASLPAWLARVRRALPEMWE